MDEKASGFRVGGQEDGGMANAGTNARVEPEGLEIEQGTKGFVGHGCGAELGVEAEWVGLRTANWAPDQRDTKPPKWCGDPPRAHGNMVDEVKW